MARSKTPLLTDRESEIMVVLWNLGSATAADVRSQISGDPHDSTVRTMLRVLITKGYVAAARAALPIVYRPAVKRQSMQKKVTRNLIKRFFGGSGKQLLLHLLGDEQLSLAQIKTIEEAVVIAQSKKTTNDRNNPRT